MKNRLKQLRKESTSKSQRDFYKDIISDELNIKISFRTYQNWENPDNSIKPDKAQILADYFQVRVDYLLGYSSIADPELYRLMVKANTSTSESNFQFTMEATESDEHDLLYNYRQLSDPFKNHAREYVRDLKKLQVSIENDK